MKTKDPTPGDKYPWIRARCQMMGSYEPFAQEQQRTAAKIGAPVTATRVMDGETDLLEEVTNPDTQQWYIEWAVDREILVPVDIFNAWTGQA